MPIVLLDRIGGTYWKAFARFVIEELAGAGLVSVTDLDRVVVTDSPEEAIEAVSGFWRNYDSLRWSGDRLVLRLRAEPSDAELAGLNERFSGLCATGTIERTAPLPEEVSGGDRLDLPRIVLTPRRQAVGDLYRLIGALNELESAPSALGGPAASGEAAAE